MTAPHPRVTVVCDASAALATIDLAAALPGCSIVAADDLASTRSGLSPAAMGTAFKNCDVLLLDLTDAASLRRVVDAVLQLRASAASPSRTLAGIVVLDLSPVAPEAARECAAALAAAGDDYVGAALVRRGVAECVAYVDAGADQASLGVLGLIADPVIEVGDLGSAKVVRILDATMAAVNATVTAEALGLVSRLGLSDAEVVARVSLGSGAHAGLAKALDGDDGPVIDRACDDINMALELSRLHRRSTFFAAAALSAMRGASGMGLGSEPLRAVRQWFVRGAGRGKGAST